MTLIFSLVTHIIFFPTKKKQDISTEFQFLERSADMIFLYQVGITRIMTVQNTKKIDNR